MSKLVDRLKQVTEGVPQPFGFGRFKVTASKPKLQLIASAAAHATRHPTTDADAAFTTSGSSIAEFKDLLAKADIIWGMEASDGVDVKAIEEAGADFVVFSLDTPVEALADTKLGKVLRVDSSLGDTLLRSLNVLAVDVVLLSVDAKSGALTFQDLMAIHRIAGMLNKPSLVTLPAPLTKKTLTAVWNSGVDGVVVSASGVELKTLRETINSLEYRTPPKREHLAIVPHPAPEPEEAEDEGGEEDE